MYLLLDPKANPGIDNVVISQFQGASTARIPFGTGNTGNGTFVGILADKTLGTFEWDVKVTAISPQLKIQVVKKQRGVVTDLSDTTLTDAVASFTPGALVGLTLIPDENSPGTTAVITANTANSISVASGLLSDTIIGSTYAVVLNTDSNQFMADSKVTGAAAGNSVPVSNSAGFVDDLQVVLADASGNILQYNTVSGAPPDGTHVVLDSAPPTLANNYHITQLYASSDNLFKFGMNQGTTPFVNGDNWFIDSFAYLGDITIRDQDLVELLLANLKVNVVGGIVQ